MSPVEEEHLRDLLHRSGLKSTGPRLGVLRLLEEEPAVRTAEEIHQKLLAAGKKADVSTVYRILELFSARGLAEKQYLPEERRYGFLLRAAGHVHRLICVRCRRVVEIDHCPLEAFEKAIEAETHFAIRGHDLEWYGLCPACRAAEKKDK